MYKPLSKKQEDPKASAKKIAEMIGDTIKSNMIDQSSSEEITKSAYVLALKICSIVIKGRQLFTDSEIASIYGLSDRTLRNMRCQNRGPSYIKLDSGSVRYRMEHIEAWISRNTSTPQS